MSTHSTTATPWRIRLGPLLATLLILVGQLFAAWPAAQ